MNLRGMSEDYLRALEKKVSKILLDNSTNRQQITRTISDEEKKFLERIRREIFITLRVETDKSSSLRFASSILGGYSRLGDKIEADLLFEIKRGVKKDLAVAEVAKNIRGRLDVADSLSKTLARTASVGIGNARKIRDGVDAGLTFFRYAGSQSPERDFCQKNVNKIFSLEEIRKMDNGQGLAVEFFCGGYNCRHFWVPVESKDVPVPSPGAKKIQTPKKKKDPVPKKEATPKKTPAKKKSAKDPERDASGKLKFYKDLEPGQAIAYDKIRDLLGIEMPESFYRDDFELGLELRITPGEGSSVEYPIKMNIDTARHKDPNNLRGVIAHEGGHVSHNSKKRIISHLGRDAKTAIEFLANKEAIYAGAKSRQAKADRELELGRKLRDLHSRRAEIWMDLVQRFPEKNYTRADVDEMVGTVADWFGALTRNKIGWGHTNNYYKERKAGREAEWWANSYDLKYSGNIVFEENFPELYRMAIESIELLVKGN